MNFIMIFTCFMFHNFKMYDFSIIEFKYWKTYDFILNTDLVLIYYV